MLQNVSLTKKLYCDYCNNYGENVINSQYYLDVISDLQPAYAQVDKYVGNPNAVVVVDCDDTLISTFPFIKSRWDFGWTMAAIIESWNISTSALLPAIKPMQDFVAYCMTKGVRCRILTGREEKYRTITETLLLNNGYKQMFESMEMKPTGSSLHDEEFKQLAVKKWQNEGLGIILMVGDQQSDMTTTADLSIRIRNYCYDLSISY